MSTSGSRDDIGLRKARCVLPAVDNISAAINTDAVGPARPETETDLEVARMRIVNPTYGESVAGGEAAATAPFDWMTDSIALFSNSKPNARELMDGLKAKLAHIRSVDNVSFIYKPSASQPAPAATMDEVVQKYRAALLALGD